MAQARVRVRMTVDIDIGGGGWGDDCTVEQIRKQALESAREAIMRGLVIGGQTIKSPACDGGTIVGEPEVTAIITELGKR